MGGVKLVSVLFSALGLHRATPRAASSLACSQLADHLSSARSLGLLQRLHKFPQEISLGLAMLAALISLTAVLNRPHRLPPLGWMAQSSQHISVDRYES